MEVNLENVSWTATPTEVELLLAKHLHHPHLLGSRTDPFNFHVDLYKDPRGMQPHSGSGVLTMPTSDIGTRFLALYGTSGLKYKGRTIALSPSRRKPRPEILERIRILDSYVDPRILEEVHHRSGATGTRVGVKELQFCWECRDKVLSVESEASPSNCHLTFDEKRRFCIGFTHRGAGYRIVNQSSQIESIAAHLYQRHEPVIIFTLSEPSSLEIIKQTPSTSGGPSREQLSHLPIPDNHKYVVPYVSLIIRLVCQTKADLERFRNLCHTSGFRNIRSGESFVDRRALFAKRPFELYSDWLKPEQLPWVVAFQVDAILRRRTVNVREMLDILPTIKERVRSEGKQYVASLLRDFSPKVASLHQSGNAEAKQPSAVRKCFESLLKDFKYRPPRQVMGSDRGLWDAFHVTVTPTTLILDGPHPERSNRVVRSWGKDNHESFLRVSFAEEGGYKLKFDREVDGEAYIRSRIKKIFVERLVIATREFEFLAYSQSALKEHTVW